MKQWEIERLERVRELITDAKKRGEPFNQLTQEAIKLDKRLKRGKTKRPATISYC